MNEFDREHGMDAAPEPAEAAEAAALEAEPAAEFVAPEAEAAYEQVAQQYQAPPPPPYQPPPQYQAPMYAEPPLHVPSLVVGILALVFALTTGFVGLILGIVGVVMAKKAKNEYKTGVGFGLSLAGLIIGAIITIIFIATFALLGSMGLGLMGLL
ncbi:MAG: hypothetical protein FWH32_02770 [Clostridiales bacterium]|nr:hypothetical protein [Clostridiales bacterium]